MSPDALRCERCGECLSKHIDDLDKKGWLCYDGHYYAGPVRPVSYFSGSPCEFQGPLTKYGSFYYRDEYERN